MDCALFLLRIPAIRIKQKASKCGKDRFIKK
jgi:hypothetical protein